jgi:cobaltochelatase CobN
MGDVVQTIDDLAKHLLSLLAQQQFHHKVIPDVIGQTFAGLYGSAEASEIEKVLHFVCNALVPSLRQTSDEITNLLTALGGEFVPAGPSGSPTRGMAHLLPTGRNFYACDPNALPSHAAWEVGQGLAREVLNRYYKDEKGAYPEHVVSMSVSLESSSRVVNVRLLYSPVICRNIFICIGNQCLGHCGNADTW